MSSSKRARRRRRGSHRVKRMEDALQRAERERDKARDWADFILQRWHVAVGLLHATGDYDSLTKTYDEVERHISVSDGSDPEWAKRVRR